MIRLSPTYPGKDAGRLPGFHGCAEKPRRPGSRARTVIRSHRGRRARRAAACNPSGCRRRNRETRRRGRQAPEVPPHGGKQRIDVDRLGEERVSKPLAPPADASGSAVMTKRGRSGRWKFSWNSRSHPLTAAIERSVMMRLGRWSCRYSSASSPHAAATISILPIGARGAMPRAPRGRRRRGESWNRPGRRRGRGPTPTPGNGERGKGTVAGGATLEEGHFRFLSPEASGAGERPADTGCRSRKSPAARAPGGMPGRGSIRASAPAPAQGRAARRAPPRVVRCQRSEAARLPAAARPDRGNSGDDAELLDDPGVCAEKSRSSACCSR